jgi:hypothetical protein
MAQAAKFALVPLHAALFFFASGCLWEETSVDADFEYIKLTETRLPLSPYFVRGTIGNMRFSHSTNDPFYSHTTFMRLSEIRAAIPPLGWPPSLIFQIGEFGRRMPVWTYVNFSPAGSNRPPIDLIRGLKQGNQYRNDSRPPVGEDGRHTEDWLTFTMVIEYFNPRINIWLARGFTTNTSPDGILTILENQETEDHFFLTFGFVGTLMAMPVIESGGRNIPFGEANIEMRVRVDK